MTDAPGRPSAPDARALAARVAAGAAILAALAALLFLGTWQVHRLAWKRALIARVDARVHAAPVPPPGPASWSTIDAARDEYLRVRVEGRFADGRETLVQASTELGPGYWVLTPLGTSSGETVLVNRGFVPPERADPATRAAPASPVAVTGLLRMSEPGGGFLRSNDPAENHWYSRDVAAIAAARRLGTTAPFFIDADAAPNPGGYPVGGLTVIAFPNNHLLYALTWYGMAAMLAGAVAWHLRDAARRGAARFGAGRRNKSVPS